MSIYLIGSLLVFIVGFLYNRTANYILQLPLGGVLVLALFSWFGLAVQLIVGLTQLDARWFNPRGSR